MRKSIKIFLAIAVLIVSGVIIYYQLNNTNNKELFFDNATFGEFSDEKTEVFELTESSEVEFLFKSKISSGLIYVEVKDSNDNTIYKNGSKSINDKFTKELQAGEYYYYLKASNAESGYFTYRAQVK